MSDGGVTVSPGPVFTSVALLPEANGTIGEIAVGGIVINQPMQTVSVFSSWQLPPTPGTFIPMQIEQLFVSQLADTIQVQGVEPGGLVAGDLFL